MTFNPAIHRRRTIRLQSYDYSQAGAYFVTTCTQNRECLFGEEVADGKMQLNNAERMVEAAWRDLPHHYAYVRLDSFVIMPNHVHGVIFITR
ncbi:transposase-like protein [Candidatus Nitrosoglobus terrae]|uniref:Transposase-like protein n=1 Tax=Candidatus Nitrosoglobus terrae TaxID=1630141 RepID=A0A1Q2SNS5_9GAMM|nr:transposase [Candidatus Nitrosoglobus terrae]BAW80786.1 transposase-like protein [Candidatus Nitrosoglobus terrae]